MYYERTSGRKRKLRCIIDWLNSSNPSFPRTEFDPVPMEEIVARVDDYLDETGYRFENPSLKEDFHRKMN